MDDRDKRIYRLLHDLASGSRLATDFAPSDEPDLLYAVTEGFVAIADRQPLHGDMEQPRVYSITNKGKERLKTYRR